MTKTNPALFKRPAVALTVPSPWWWFLLSGVPLREIEAVAESPIFPAGFAHRGPLYIHASAEFPWDIVRVDALDLIRSIGWRRTPKKWPSMYDMRSAAGRIVGAVMVSAGTRSSRLVVSPLSFLNPVVACADGVTAFSLSPAILAMLKTEVAA